MNTPDQVTKRYLGQRHSLEPAAGGDSQNLIASGYKCCIRRTYFLKIVPDEQVASNGLQVLQNHGWVKQADMRRICDKWKSLSSALTDIRKPTATEHFAAADIGFSYEGLRKLNIRQELLEVFRRKSPAFQEGAYQRAHRHLLDTGLSDPVHWREPYGPPVSKESFDVVIFMHLAADVNKRPFQRIDSLLLEAENRLVQHLFEPGVLPLLQPLNGQWVEEAAPLDNHGHEHFGYKDGITSPKYIEYDKFQPQKDKYLKSSTHALGEILLGHKRNDGEDPYADLQLPKRKVGNWDPSDEPYTQEYLEFFKNSSFGVLRRMEQQVQEFERWVDEQAHRFFKPDSSDGLNDHPNTDLYSVRKTWIRSQVLGRTPQGLRLTAGMSWDAFQERKIQPAIDELGKAWGNEGGFHKQDVNGRTIAGDDSRGLGCPFASHIRRMNPQDDPIAPFIHRPLLRRGMPYTDESGVGLSGLFICSDLVEQFEHLMGKWANHRVMGLTNTSEGRDPLIGNHADAGPHLTTTTTTPDGMSIALPLSKTFVVTRGCAYLWFPSIPVLTCLPAYT